MGKDRTNGGGRGERTGGGSNIREVDNSNHIPKDKVGGVHGCGHSNGNIWGKGGGVNVSMMTTTNLQRQPRHQQEEEGEDKRGVGFKEVTVVNDMAYHQKVTTDDYKTKEVLHYTPS